MENHIPSDFIININRYQIINRIETYPLYNLSMVENSDTKDRFLVFESTNKSLFLLPEIYNVSQTNYPSYYIPIGFSNTNLNNQDFPSVFYKYMQRGTLNFIFSAMKNEFKRDTKMYIILLGIALAMNRISTNNDVNHNLSPDNIFLDDNDYPLFLYFGKSGMPNKDYINSNISYNKKLPIYVAPEVLENGQFTCKADVYSFSLILYQIITGLAPYAKLHNKSSEEFTKKIISGYRPDVSIIKSEKIRDLLNLLWDKDPTKRPSFKEVISEITQYSFFKIFNINNKLINQYLTLYGNEYTSLIESFDKNSLEIDDNDIKMLSEMTGKSEDIILHVIKELNDNPVNLSNSEDNYQQIISITMEDLGFKRRVAEIFVILQNQNIKPFSATEVEDNVRKEYLDGDSIE